MSVCLSTWHALRHSTTGSPINTYLIGWPADSARPPDNFVSGLQVFNKRVFGGFKYKEFRAKRAKQNKNTQVIGAIEQSDITETMSPNSQLLFAIVTSLTLLHTCAAQYRNSPYGVREIENKKPYEFNDAEMTAIQTIMAFRDVIGELLGKVGFNIPTLASIITRSDMNHVKAPVRVSEPLAASPAKSGGFTSALLRGVALSLPLLIPMATQIRRMSAEPPYIPPIPFIPDPYYDKALHRRRGRRSVPMPYRINQLKQLEIILRQIEDMRRQYDRTWYEEEWHHLSE